MVMKTRPLPGNPIWIKQGHWINRDVNGCYFMARGKHEGNQLRFVPSTYLVFLLRERHFRSLWEIKVVQDLLNVRAARLRSMDEQEEREGRA